MAEPHPQVVDPRHPLVDRVRQMCMPYPDAEEVTAWGRPTFRAGKRIFVLVGSMAQPLSVVVKAAPDELPALRADDRFWNPPYWTNKGWVGTALDTASTDWDEIAELIDTSYRQVALVRQVKALGIRTAD
jgi:predicted DNA-binding protein (MmcQ/YjbR family)